eukprot:TRINITY_DN80636_c0_g1_i1.p1 TRINITY_DN80636_c0_g1~~TRINITY_DN80636_c0_g1_i1.p1  ORF type:complete len:358 (+),score=86.20 TRINITY_DN80636_c0_g1_i1:266-1339(+)
MLDASPLDLPKCEVVVTGGSGFVGSHVAHLLSTKGVQVLIMDRVKPKLFDPSSWKTPASFIQCDVCDREKVERVFREVKPKAVVHMAALIEVEEAERRPDLYYMNNVEGTRVVLEAMNRVGVPYILFSSTAAVYGDTDPSLTRPLKEEEAFAAHTMNTQLGVYARTKITCEWLVHDYIRALPGIRAGIIFRYFNAAGATPDAHLGEHREHESHLIPIALSRLLRGAAVHVFGSDYPTHDGTCVRDYVHVRDIADAHWVCMEPMMTDDVADSSISIYNLGTATGLSVLDVTNECLRVCGIPREGHVVMTGRRAGDVPVLVADASLAEKELGWKAKLTVKDIVEDTYKWLDWVSKTQAK